MTRGTKSVLFGVHQFVLHPAIVFLAWWRLYGFPWDPRVWICIGLHDLGYIGKPEMDSEDGERHVEWAAWASGALFGRPWYEFCLGHSLHYAKKANVAVSRLCFADKLAICLYPERLYFLLARASGELAEYRMVAARAGFVSSQKTDHEWKTAIDERMRHLVASGDASTIPYFNAAAREGK